MLTNEVIGTAQVTDAANPGKKHIRFMEALEDALQKVPAPQGGDVQTYVVKEMLVEYGGIAMVTLTKVRLQVIYGKAPW